MYYFKDGRGRIGSADKPLQTEPFLKVFRAKKENEHNFLKEFEFSVLHLRNRTSGNPDSPNQPCFICLRSKYSKLTMAYWPVLRQGELILPILIGNIEPFLSSSMDLLGRTGWLRRMRLAKVLEGDHSSRDSEKKRRAVLHHVNLQ